MPAHGSIGWNFAEDPLVFQQGVTVGHPGEVVANCPRPAIAPRPFARLDPNRIVVFEIITE
jgi:hypothetical protein